MTNSQYKPGRNTGVALCIASGILIVSALLPWISATFSWTGTGLGGQSGEISYRVNGLGFGTGSADINYQENATYGYNVSTSWNTSPRENLEILPLGGTLIVLGIFNLVFAMNFIDERTRKLVPRKLREFMENRHTQILLAEGVLASLVPFVFSIFYFQMPVKTPLHTITKLGLGGSKARFTSSEITFFEFYRNSFKYFSLLNSRAASSMVINRDLAPGMGYFLAWFGGLLLIYTWFMNLIQKEGWPQVWRRRTLLFPLMIMLAFLPLVVLVSKSEGVMPPLLLSRFYHHAIGPIYLILTVLFFYLSRKTALLERNLSEKTRDLYAKEELKGEELEEELNKITDMRTRSGKWRVYIGLIALAILIAVGAIIASILGFYMGFLGLGQEIKLMNHTIWNWLLLICPIGTLVLIAVYHR